MGRKWNSASWISVSKYVDNNESNTTKSHRTRQRENFICSLYNATYDVSFSWADGVPKVAGSTTLGHRMSFHAAAEAQKDSSSSDMARHAYAAFMWVVTDQVVGSMGWYEDFPKNNSEHGFEGDPGYSSTSAAVSTTLMIRGWQG